MKLQEIVTRLEKVITVFGKSPSATLPSVFIWGPPGIGKSTVVKNLAEKLNIGFVDVRLSQLAPTDLRGLPSIDKQSKVLEWIAPKFLPRERDSKGILFLDEFNMATGSLQGIAQQLILDRCVGDYILPEGWVIVGAGNRSSDRAAVNEMPSPVANRFLHFDATAELSEFKDLVFNHFGFSDDTSAAIAGFLNFRPEMLHKNSNKRTNMPAWPSPRTWQMAGHLHDADLDVAHAIGGEAATQFKAFLKLKTQLPDLQAILDGERVAPLDTGDASIVSSLVSSLLAHSKTCEHYTNALSWLLTNKKITEDYFGLFVKDMLIKLDDDKALMAKVVTKIMRDKSTKEFMTKYKNLVTSFGSK